jgi:hypothetical protein
MSYYTQVKFTLPKNHKIEHVEKTIGKLFEPTTVKRIYDKRLDNLYELTIYELDFHESKKILDVLKSKYSIQFTIEHAVY